MTNNAAPDAPLVPETFCHQADFGHSTGTVTCEETHMSWVFLTGPFAYKIKKPVKFPFADFSTLAQRRHWCDEELRVNRRLSPQLYVDVVPIGGTHDRPVIGRTPAFEYAVKLVQFDPAMRLDKQLKRGLVSTADGHQLAQSIWSFQQDLPRVPTNVDVGNARYIKRLALTNLAELAPLLRDDPRAPPLQEWTRQQVSALQDPFTQRFRAGSIREGHGDLHLQNLVRLEQRIVPFDALEFSLALRCMDTLDEVAFVAMDIMAQGRADLAFELLSHYLECCGDYAGGAVLRFYLVYRALVRAKVSALTSAATPGAEAYVRLASALIVPPPPRLVIAHGLSASGKTSVLGGLIGPLNALRLRSDLERKRIHGLDINAASASPVGGGLYGEAATERTYTTMADYADLLLRRGFSVLVDAAFLQRAQRDRFRAVAQSTGAHFAIVECTAAESVLRERITARAQAGNDASEATPAVLSYQIGAHDPLASDERRATLHVDTGQPLDSQQLAARIRAL